MPELEDKRYRVVIAAKLNGVERFFDLDTCTGKTLSSNAQIASYPVQNAETVSDHMFRQPQTMSLSGSFSLNGRAAWENNNSYTIENITSTRGSIPWDQWFAGEGKELKSLNANSRLESIQTLFEYIQAKGIICRILMADQSSSALERFKVRENMALQSISWTEKYNSMNFSFNFYEIINVGGLVDFEFFDYDTRYPSPNFPARKSLGEVMQESGDLPKLIVEALLNAGYIDEKDAKVCIAMLNGGEGDIKIKSAFRDNVKLITAWLVIMTILGQVINFALATVLVSAALGGLSAAAAGTSVALGATSGALSALTAGGLVFPVGTMVVAAAAMAVGTFVLVKKCVDNSKKRKRLKEGFNLVINYATALAKNGDIKPDVDLTKYNINQADAAKMIQLLDDIQAAVSREISNLSFYPLSSAIGDNSSRQVYVQVGNDLLNITVNVNNTAPKIGFGSTSLPALGNLYSLSLATYDGSEKIVSLNGSWPVCEDLGDFDPNKTIIYRDSSRQYELYLYNPSRNQNLQPSDSGKQLLTDNGDSSYTVEESALYNELGGYFLVVSKGPVKETVDKIAKVITSALETQGYTTD